MRFSIQVFVIYFLPIKLFAVVIVTLNCGAVPSIHKSAASLGAVQPAKEAAALTDCFPAYGSMCTLAVVGDCYSSIISLRWLGFCFSSWAFLYISVQPLPAHKKGPEC